VINLEKNVKKYGCVLVNINISVHILENVILIRAFYRREMSTEIFIYNTTLFQLVKYWKILLLHSQDQVTVETPPYKIDLIRQTVPPRRILFLVSYVKLPEQGAFFQKDAPIDSSINRCKKKTLRHACARESRTARERR